jgi:hypothetical protein
MGSILWLASYPKSGNTWLRVFLANLVANRRDPVPLAELPRYGEDEALPELYARRAGRSSPDLDLEQIAALRPLVHADIAARHAGIVFVKTHNLQGDFHGHPLHNPQVTFGAIYVVRNPLDVAISMSHHFQVDLDTAIERLGNEAVATGNGELFVSQILRSWSSHVASWVDTAGPRVLVLRYEDLLEKPVKWFGKVARLVGLGQDRARLERAIDHAGFRVLAGMEKRDGFVEAAGASARFFREGRSNQWREALSRDQVARIVAAHRKQMARFGYVPRGY